MRISEKPMKNETNAVNTYMPKTFADAIHRYEQAKEDKENTSGDNLFNKGDTSLKGLPEKTPDTLKTTYGRYIDRP